MCVKSYCVMLSNFLQPKSQGILSSECQMCVCVFEGKTDGRQWRELFWKMVVVEEALDALTPTVWGKHFGIDESC